MAAVDTRGLFDCFPNREPPKTNGEAQRGRGDDQVTFGDLLGFVVGGEESYHGMLEELSFGRGASGFVFHRVYRGLEDAKEGEKKRDAMGKVLITRPGNEKHTHTYCRARAEANM